MDALELLNDWPGVRDLSPAEILAHPAWRMSVDFGGDAALLTRIAADAVTDPICLALTLDDESHLLQISNSAVLPDLYALRAHFSELPETLVLALIEKEAGALLQTIENVVRKEIKLVGLKSAAETTDLCAFKLESAKQEFRFALDLPPDVIEYLGVLDNLDVEHASVRSLVRPVRAEYAALELAEEEISSLKSGDFLVDGANREATWQTALPDDGILRVCDAAETQLTFAQFADGNLPPVPPPVDLEVFLHGRKIAVSAYAQIGDTAGFRIVETT